MRAMTEDWSQPRLLVSGVLLTIFGVPCLLDTSLQSLPLCFQGLPLMHVFVSKFPLFIMTSHIGSETHSILV